MAQHGVKMEAFKFTSTLSDSASSWIGQQRAYANSYANPVVLGQVMTANDPRLSVFWSRGPSRVEAPTSTTCSSANTSVKTPSPCGPPKWLATWSWKVEQARSPGWISWRGSGPTVVGPGQWTAGSLSHQRPGWSGRGHRQRRRSQWPGRWLGRAGGPGIDFATGLRLFIEEDNLADPERVHATERVAYVVFAASGAPTITSTPVTSATEDAAYSYDVNATDPDVGDTLTYSLTTAPTGMTINATTGLISWTPTNAQVGANAVTVRVRDVALAAGHPDLHDHRRQHQRSARRSRRRRSPRPRRMRPTATM